MVLFHNKGLAEDVLLLNFSLIGKFAPQTATFITKNNQLIRQYAV
jgi:hypothetical protein